MPETSDRWRRTRFWIIKETQRFRSAWPEWPSWHTFKIVGEITDIRVIARGRQIPTLLRNLSGAWWTKLAKIEGPGSPAILGSEEDSACRNSLVRSDKMGRGKSNPRDSLTSERSVNKKKRSELSLAYAERSRDRSAGRQILSGAYWQDHEAGFLHSRGSIRRGLSLPREPVSCREGSCQDAEVMARLSHVAPPELPQEIDRGPQL